MTKGLPWGLVLFIVVVAAGATAVRAQGETREPSPVTAAVQTQVPIQVPIQEQRRLRVFVGKSLVVQSAEPLRRVSVTDPRIASATIINPFQVLIHGHVPAGVSLILWDEQERMRTYDLQVELDLAVLRETVRQALPNENVSAMESDGSIVLTGTVSSKQVADQAVALAKTLTEKVVSLLVEVGGQVLLQVRVAEVDRVAIQQLGVNLFATGLTIGGAKIIGDIGTKQFVQTLGNVGAVPRDVQRGRDPDAPNLAAGAVGNLSEGIPAVFGLSDLANIFVFLPDRNVGAVIKALEQRNLLEILAEPNLLAQNGREASFLAGGEFPFPTVQGISGGLPAVTIQFREFGVRLKFTPAIQTDGTMSLKVAQEVSSLDFSNALTISGFVVPALSTRKAETELQLRDGQSFAIAGLIDNRLTEVATKIPGLGDIPIIGKLFRARALQRNNTELLVIVTPKLVRPLEAGEPAPLPMFPGPFLDKERFDAKKPPKPEESTKK